MIFNSLAFNLSRKPTLNSHRYHQEHQRDSSYYRFHSGILPASLCRGVSERLNALGAALIGEPGPFWRAIERRRGALTDARRLSAAMRRLRRAGAQSEDEDLEPTDEELREIECETT